MTWDNWQQSLDTPADCVANLRRTGCQGTAHPHAAARALRHALLL